MTGLNRDRSVFLMPFTPKSILVFYLLKNNGIEVIGFCDNDTSLSSKHFDGAKIISPAKATKLRPDAAVILCERAHFESNEKQLRESGFVDIIGMQKLLFIDRLQEYIPKLNVEFYASLIPKQVPYGKQFLHILSTFDTWDQLMEDFYFRHEIPEIPEPPYCYNEWLVYKPRSDDIPSFLILVNATGYTVGAYLGECIGSLLAQKHTRFFMLFIIAVENRSLVEEELEKKGVKPAACIPAENSMTNIETVAYAREHFADYGKHDFIVTIGVNDMYSADTLALLAVAVNANDGAEIITANEDRVYDNEYIAPFYKRDYQKLKLLNSVQLLRNLICVRAGYNGDISETRPDDIYIDDRFLYHYRVIDGAGHDNKIKPIAFYLPQFHAIPENDEWWGKGFTEWDNVKRAVPMFDGHYQPHIPGQFGYYDLVKDNGIQKRQMELARQYGIYGFCYYYYWFSGKRLLEKPLDNVLGDPSLDMPFCICWANENWTRRWDGLESEILIEQRHDDESDRRFMLDIIPILKDSRYIKIDGKPLLVVYRAIHFPDFRRTVSNWRVIAAQNGIERLHISYVLNDHIPSCADYGCDSVTEFPPNQSPANNIDKEMSGVNTDFSGAICDYGDYARRSMSRRQTQQLCFRGIMLGFDNTARMMERAAIFAGVTPNVYIKLLISLVDYTSRYPEEERLIFINAWNEWAEGAHLEPDEKYGEAFLEATRKAIEINC